MTVRFVVPGNPVPKARPRTVRRGGKAVTYTPAKTARYERGVAALAAEAMAGRGPFQGPVAVRVRLYRQDRRRVDGDNCCKALLDAMNGVVYDDDHQVVECCWSKAVDRERPRAEVAVCPAAEKSSKF